MDKFFNLWVKLGRKFYYNPIVKSVLHTSVFCLSNALDGCESVLDLGCGHMSPLQHISGIKYSVGVERFLPYLEDSRRKGIHTKYLCGDISEVQFKAKSFDAVLLSSVIEHLTKAEGLRLLRRAERIARKKVVVITCNGYLPFIAMDGNELQKHKSGWRVEEFRGFGYRVRGQNGFKLFRGSSSCDDSKDFMKALLSPIKWRPKLFWFAVSELSQMAAYYLPNLAYEIFAVKYAGGETH